MIYVHDEVARLRLRVTGAFNDDSSRELASCWATASSVVAGRKVIVDLRELSGECSPVGRDILARLHQEGAEFLIRTSGQRELVEQITGVQTVKTSNPVGQRMKNLFSLTR